MRAVCGKTTNSNRRDSLGQSRFTGLFRLSFLVYPNRAGAEGRAPPNHLAVSIRFPRQWLHVAKSPLVNQHPPPPRGSQSLLINPLGFSTRLSSRGLAPVSISSTGNPAPTRKNRTTKMSKILPSLAPACSSASGYRHYTKVHVTPKCPVQCFTLHWTSHTSPMR